MPPDPGLVINAEVMRLVRKARNVLAGEGHLADKQEEAIEALDKAICRAFPSVLGGK